MNIIIHMHCCSLHYIIILHLKCMSCNIIANWKIIFCGIDRLLLFMCMHCTIISIHVTIHVYALHNNINFRP